MQYPLRYFSITLGVIATAILFYDAFKILRALRASSSPAMQVAAYSSSPDNPRVRLLVIGDSTAVGTGASNPHETVAGRIGRDRDDLYLENRAAVGALTADLQEQLAASSPKAFDAVLVQVGGNDILRWTPLASLRQQLNGVLEAANRRAPQVVLIVPGLVGNAPAIPWPVSHLLNHRARAVRQLCREAAADHGVYFVDLTREVGGETGSQPASEQYYARDGLHPSAQGYRRWYSALREQSPILQWLQPPGEQAVKVTTGGAR